MEVLFQCVWSLRSPLEVLMYQRIGRCLLSSSPRRPIRFLRRLIFDVGTYVSGYTSFRVFLLDVYDSGDNNTGWLTTGFVGAFRKD